MSHLQLTSKTKSSYLLWGQIIVNIEYTLTNTIWKDFMNEPTA